MPECARERARAGQCVPDAKDGTDIWRTTWGWKAGHPPSWAERGRERERAPLVRRVCVGERERESKREQETERATEKEREDHSWGVSATESKGPRYHSFLAEMN